MLRYLWTWNYENVGILFYFSVFTFTQAIITRVVQNCVLQLWCRHDNVVRSSVVLGTTTLESLWQCHRRREFVLVAPLRFLLVSRTQGFSHDPTRKNQVESDQANWTSSSYPLFRECPVKVLSSMMWKVRWGSIMLKLHTVRRRDSSGICSTTREVCLSKAQCTLLQLIGVEEEMGLLNHHWTTVTT